MFIVFFFPFFICAEETKVYDNADVFSIYEENMINNKINKYVYNYNMDFVVLTTLINTEESTYKYVQKFINENNFGIGKYKSGIVFIIDKDNKNNKYYFFGEASKYVDKKRRKDINNYINDMYKRTNKNYYALVSSFIDKIDYYTNSGVPKTNLNKYISSDGKLRKKHKYPLLFSVFTSVVLSILFTSIIVYLLTKKKKKNITNYKAIINYEIKDDVLINSKEN